MGNAVGWPYGYVGITEALDASQTATVTAVGADYSAVSVSGGNITAAGISVPIHDITDNCRLLQPTNSALAVSFTGVGSKAVNERRGREQGSVDSEWFLDYDTNKSADLLRYNRGGVRLLYAERDNPAVEELFGVVSLMDVTDGPMEQSGLQTFSVRFVNSSHEAVPEWKKA